MNDHSHGHDRTTNATLVFLVLFIAAVVAVVETYRDVCADGVKRSASEIFALVNARRPNTSRPSFDSIFYTIGLQSQRDHESAHHSAKVYWLPSPNVVGERNDTSN